MKMFGYLCSPFCRQKAERSNLAVPKYEFSNQVQERKYQRKLMTTIVGVLGILALAAAGWIWYVTVGSQPKTVYTSRFAAPAATGRIQLVGRNDLLVLHGSTLSRHDVKQQREVWSASLVSRTKLLAEATTLQPLVAQGHRQQHANDPAPTLEQIAALLEQEYLADLQFFVRQDKLWVVQPDKLVRYDWVTGKSAQEVALSFGFGGVQLQGDELIALRPDAPGAVMLTRLNLVTGRVGQDKFRSTELPSFAEQVTRALTEQRSPRSASLDPARIAAQAQRLPVQGRLALPATISIQQGQNRLLQEIDELDNGPAPAPQPPTTPAPDRSEHVTVLITRAGPVEFSRQLLEERLVERSALKPPPARSALEGAANAANMAEIANELLNENTRSRGADKVIENESRYRVAVRWPSAPKVPEWRAELTGPPSIHALTSLNLVIAGKSVVALDLQNRKLWEHSLSYPLARADRSSHPNPIVERGGLVFIADQGVLTALDSTTGNVRWRFPSVGVSGLLFDDHGMLYVNSTTADPDSLKYSRQIDLTKTVQPLIVKLNPQDGTTLWRAESMGAVAHVTGKHVYTVAASLADDGAEVQAVLGIRPSAQSGFTRIRCLNAKNGIERWKYDQNRVPLDVGFSGKNIQLLFPDEAQLLRFLAF